MQNRCAKEAEQIKGIEDKLLADGNHLDHVQELLRTIRQAAREGDQEDGHVVARHAFASGPSATPFESIISPLASAIAIPTILLSSSP